MNIRSPLPGDFEVIRSMLAEAGLPVTDFLPDHLAFTAADDDTPIGAIGIEAFGDIGLLRSLVVSRDARSRGLGRRLVDALEAGARGEGIVEIWLLTIDADPFFAKLGYEPRDRADAPLSIRQTAEFSGLCPDDAVLMSKRL